MLFHRCHRSPPARRRASHFCPLVVTILHQHGTGGHEGKRCVQRAAAGTLPAGTRTICTPTPDPPASHLPGHWAHQRTCGTACWAQRSPAPPPPDQAALRRHGQQLLRVTSPHRQRLVPADMGLPTICKQQRLRVLTYRAALRWRHQAGAAGASWRRAYARLAQAGFHLAPQETLDVWPAQRLKVQPQAAAGKRR